MLNALKTKMIGVPRVHAMMRDKRSPVFTTVFDPLPADYRGFDLQGNPGSKVAVIGLPKSGNNWLLGLLSTCLDLNVIENPRDSAGGIFMTHQSFAANLYFDRNIRYGVYIMRDLRDIICSYYQYVQKGGADGGRHIAGKFDDLESFYFEYFLSHLSRLYDYPGHAEQYLQYELPMVLYERLWDNPVRELERLFERWGCDVSSETIAAAVEAHDFKKMKKEGKSARGHDVPKGHMRKGGYGNYLEEMPANVIADVEERFGDYLKRWGYTLNVGAPNKAG